MLDLAGFDGFIAGVKREGKRHIYTSEWFNKRYGNLMGIIRGNMGNQDNVNLAPKMCDAIVEQCLTDDIDPPEVEIRRTGPHGKLRKCCLCNLSKNCPHTLWVLNPTKGEILQENIAICCSALA